MSRIAAMLAAPPADQGFRLDPLEFIHRSWDRPSIMIQAALHLVARRPWWARGGRGPDRFDNFGFVRACVQAAGDFDRASGTVVPRNLADFVKDADPSPAQICKAVEGWGLVQAGLAGDAKPGDVVVFANSAALGVCITKGQGRNMAVAASWEPTPPCVTERIPHGLIAVRAYRWPSE